MEVILTIFISIFIANMLMGLIDSIIFSDKKDLFSEKDE